jgi:signal transduction histidine kinase
MVESTLTGGRKIPLPSWALNLIGFGLLITLVLAVFFWQMTTIDRDLQRNTIGRSQMIAAIIEEHLANAALARSTIDGVVTTFLRDKVRFVDYLNTIDPLQDEELTALARETGLLGIGVVHQDGTAIVGPAEWRQQEQRCSPAHDTIHYDQDGTGLFIGSSSNEAIRCIVVGLNAEAIIRLQEKTALPTLLANLSRLPGIHAVSVAPDSTLSGEAVRLIDEHGRWIVETRLPMASGTLVIGLDATQHFHRVTLLRRQFLLFSALLLTLGLFFSWFLYRVQQADLNRTRTFERLLAREHEAAALGRATATIAHEVRNPLNAISMGLQRLRLESVHLDTGQQELVDAMQDAVNRASGIIGELQRFTRTLSPRRQSVDPASLFQRILALYRQRCQDQDINVACSDALTANIEADPDLLAELLENLLKNSIEAQPNGGFVRITLKEESGSVKMTMTNGGCTLSAKESTRLGDPYFTTKTRGTGLGLALCRRIAEAHGGRLDIAVDASRQHFTVDLSLPRTAPAAVVVGQVPGGPSCIS